MGSVGAGAQPRCKASQGHQGSVLQVGAGSHLVVSRMFVTFVEAQPRVFCGLFVLVCAMRTGTAGSKGSEEGQSGCELHKMKKKTGL